MGLLVAMAFHGGCLCASGRYFRSSGAIAFDFHLRLLCWPGVPWRDSFRTVGAPLDARTQNHSVAYGVVRHWDTLRVLEERKFPDLYTCVAKNAFYIFSLDPNFIDDEKDSRAVVGDHPERTSRNELFNH